MKIFEEYNLPEDIIGTMESLISQTIEDKNERSFPLCSIPKTEKDTYFKKAYRELTKGEECIGHYCKVDLNTCTGPGEETVGYFHTHLQLPGSPGADLHDFSFWDYVRGWQLGLHMAPPDQKSIVCVGKPDHSIVCQQLTKADPELAKTVNEQHLPDTKSGNEHGYEIMHPFYGKEETVRAPEGVTIHGVPRGGPVNENRFAEWYGGYKNAVDKAVEKGLDFDNIYHHPIHGVPDTKPISPEVQKIKDSISTLLSTVHDPSNKAEIIKHSIAEHQVDWRKIDDSQWVKRKGAGL